jgi:hypothetical protein
MKKDLRARKRMPTANLKASLQISKGILDSIWEEVRPMNFSLFGMGLKTNRTLKVDSKVTLSLTLEIDMGEIHIEKIKARVVRMNKLVGFYEYGIEFDKKIVENANSQTAQNLMRIENFLSKQEALSAKMSQQSA